MATNGNKVAAEKIIESSRDAECAELDAVVEVLAKSPRLSNLARFLGEKYFLGETDELHEYNIATEVFGRSKTSFDPGEDAIARVECHRLRKSLKKFYEGDGKNHPLQLSIPSGTYVPVFTHLSADAPFAASPHQQENPEDRIEHSDEPESAPGVSWKNRAREFVLQPRRQIWVYLLLIAALAFTALGIHRAVRPRGNLKAAAMGSTAAPVLGAGRTPSLSIPSLAYPSLPLRLIAGYNGEPHVDSAGAVWEADRYFHNGGTWYRPATFIARTSDPLLFKNWRTGDFYYDIPLKPGSYELHLFFLTWQRTDEAFSTFTVKINGETVLRAFDVNADAFGENTADERIFRDVSPDKDGFLHLSFTSERGAPALNALEVLPGLPHKQLPIRVVTQPISFTDHDGRFWHPDTYFMNGRMSDQREPIAGTSDPDLWASERYGHFNYALPVDVRGRYTLVLHFAEFYFGPSAPGGGGAGDRVFRVMCDGETLLDNFDVFKEAGSLHALTKTFYHLKPTAQGKLNLTFEPITNNATVSGIEVLDESQ